MPTSHRSRAVAALGAVAVLAVASGCKLGGVADLPLPGGAGKGGPSYTVTAMFPDVIDLVPKAFVRVDDVAVGEVDKIRLDKATLQARVTLHIKKGVVLPENVTARLRQTSLLGEKFIALGPPTGQAASGTLADGAVIPADRTERFPEVEEFFAAFSSLANGGGLGQLQSIVTELSAALAGREGNVRDLLKRLNTITKAVDDRKGDIVRAVDSLDRLTSALSNQRRDIAAALDAFSPAVGVLAAQRQDLTSLLGKLSTLGQVGAKVVNKSKADTIADLKALAPTLSTVASLKTEVAKAVKNLDDLGVAVPNVIRGDYINLRIQVSAVPSALLAPPVPKSPQLGIPAAGSLTGLDRLLLGGLR